ncbi:MAG TPA: HDIG domain-containing protein [Caldithrix abyssi]|uniref:HDIG domain-containing protein n=1 Tax=Caldithrix abyssi TaxID=187145 RepID=A0A7V5RPS0_CALAY|nr:HDIG domain-containing protein [Caldithrix abyssi]
MQISSLWAKLLQTFDKKSERPSPLREMIHKGVYFLFMVVVIPLLLSTDNSIQYTDVKIGSVATKKVVAPFNFFILKTKEELKKEREAAVARVPVYFSFKPGEQEKSLDRLSRVMAYILNDNLEQRPTDTSKTILTRHNRLFRDSLGISVTTQYYSSLNRFVRENRPIKYTSGWWKKRYKNGVVDLKAGEIERDEVILIRDDIEHRLQKSQLVDMDSAIVDFIAALQKRYKDVPGEAWRVVLSQTLKPNFYSDVERTEKERQKAINSVSLTKEMVYENERIVDANERITEDIYQKLYSLEVARVERSKKEGNWQPIIAKLGRFMLAAAILFVVGLYLFSFRKKIFYDNKKLFLVTLIILLNIVIAAIISGPLNWPVYVIPTTIGFMLTAILIDSGIGFVVTVAIALLLGGIQGGGYDITMLTIVSGMISIFAVYEIRNRNQIFKAVLYIALSYLWIIGALTFLRFDSLNSMIRIFSYNLLPNAVFAPLVTYMILEVFERGFDVTTDVRLLELSDLNHPLLKELSIKAPGTFHHSMVVGNLAEAAAEEIGENSLLARVGAYYHDIGKMEKPEYFVENQMDAKNRHSELKPNMSALILVSHVKTGLELAEQYKLPGRIRDFIAEHHGTTLMNFFYNKAVALAGDKDKVSEADFRYPGPKPQSKGTAIVMMADTVEAATRTLQNPTPSRIRAFVEGLVDAKYRDGQFDECDITFKEVKQSIDAFMPILYGVFQHRIEYPGAVKPGKGAAREKNRDKNGNGSRAANGN